MDRRDVRESGRGSTGGRRTRAASDLAKKIESTRESLILTGALGIGKSFICKEAIAECAKAGQDSEKWLAILFGWEETPLRRLSEVMVVGGVGPRWVDVSRHEVDSGSLPGNLSAKTLLGPPRQIAGLLRNIFEEGGLRLGVIVDKYDSVGRYQYDEEDLRALMDLQECGASLYVEVRDRLFLPRKANDLEFSLLSRRTRIPVPSPSEGEAQRIANEMILEGSLLGNLVQTDKARSNLVSNVLSCAGDHPGAVQTLIEILEDLLSRREGDDLHSDHGRNIVTKATLQVPWRDYLEKRWRDLERLEREVLSLLAAGAALGRSWRETRELWLLASGEQAKLNEDEAEKALERLEERSGLVRCSLEEEPTLSSSSMTEFAARQELAVAILGLTSLTRLNERYFSWTSLLGWWCLSVLLYFSVSLVDFWFEGKVAYWAWWACWLPPTIYGVFFWTRTALMKRRARRRVARDEER